MKIKAKTHKGTKKRVKIKGKNKIKVNHCFSGHKKTSKTSKRKRRLRKSKMLNATLVKAARRLLHK
ncbi:50S ribosomal protein L35 [Candidatus Dependentiae bacterium]|nr:50S ribosomal protein L35 [Candidatus Dependentiae bacterium]